MLYGPKKDLLVPIERLLENLSTLATDAASKLNVLGHDGDTLGVDRTQVRVFKETDQVRLAGLLKSHDCTALEAQVSLEVLGDFTHQTLEWQLADEQLSALLVPPDLTERNSAGTVAVGLLHTTGGRRALSGSLGGQLLARRLAAGGLAGSLLGTSHFQHNVVSKLR